MAKAKVNKSPAQKIVDLRIDGARIFDPAHKIDKKAVLIVDQGKILDICDEKQASKYVATNTVDAKGMWCVPGFIDAHTHLREPGFEYKETIETGTRAAVAGGFTSVACMANTNPVNDNPYVTAFIRERAKAFGKCRVFPIGAVSKGLKGEDLAEIGGMVEQGIVAISDDGMPVMNSYLMRKAMEYAKAFNIPVISHAEDLNLVGQGVVNEGPVSTKLGLRGNPAAAEEIMVAREIALSRHTRCPMHIAHISTELGLNHVKRAKDEGLPVTAEVTPHHLFLTDEAVCTYDTHCKMAPPLRSEKDVKALRKALKEGYIDLIATDHAPHGVIDKGVEFDSAAFGIIGLQTVVPLVLRLVDEGVITLARAVSAMTSEPAKLFRLDLGTLRPGFAADFTLIDAKAEWKFTDEEVFSKSKNSPFLNWKFKGRVKMTFVEGKCVYDSNTGLFSP